MCIGARIRAGDADLVVAVTGPPAGGRRGSHGQGRDGDGRERGREQPVDVRRRPGGGQGGGELTRIAGGEPHRARPAGDGRPGQRRRRHGDAEAQRPCRQVRRPRAAAGRVDAPGGGGKRSVHSYEHYDRETGISVYTAPSVKPGKFFLYFDPVDLLSEAAQKRWADPAQHQVMVDAALKAAGAT